MNKCDSCKASKVCDHNVFGFENCGNYIPKDVVPRSEVIDMLNEIEENFEPGYGGAYEFKKLLACFKTRFQEKKK